MYQKLVYGPKPVNFSLVVSAEWRNAIQETADQAKVTPSELVREVMAMFATGQVKDIADLRKMIDALEEAS